LNILAVGLGGFIGAVLRYLIGLIPVKENMVFPVKTFCINIFGCLLIGLITVLASRNPEINPKWILFLKVGICGGFTTFSTFALETTDLIKGGHIGIAFLYAVLSAVIGIAVIFGIDMVEKIFE
jgi:CrcB protein